MSQPWLCYYRLTLAVLLLQESITLVAGTGIALILTGMALSEREKETLA